MDGYQELPLHAKVCVSKMTKNIHVYRTLTLVRIAAVFLLLKYRISNPLDDAYAIWLLAIFCEILFAINLFIYTIVRWRPVDRTTFIDRLSSRYEKPGEGSKLHPVDVFITTADPTREPPMITANTILSVLAVDYPVDKIACYVSDDSASPVIFCMMVEVSKFARKWVPFCKKYSIEPRAPAKFFSPEIDTSTNGSKSSYPEQWKALKKEYEQLRAQVDSLASSPEEALKYAAEHIAWPTDNPRDHPPIVHEVLDPKNRINTSEELHSLPRLVYVAREKRAGYKHHFKAGAINALIRVSGILSGNPFILNLDCDMYINNSKAIKHAMCFLMDPELEETVGFVQFPQIYDNLGARDVYGNRHLFLYDVLLKAMDGVRGPLYIGTGCFHRRRVLYGCEPGAKLGYEDCRLRLGPSLLLVKSVLSGLGGAVVQYDSPLLTEAKHLCSCIYEENTSWGREIGCMYGSSTEDVLTGYKIHCLGWRSIYFRPTRPAFRGVAPMAATDRLAQRKRVGCGVVEIFFSRFSPLFYSHQEFISLHRVAYLCCTFFYAGISVIIVLYATLHAACLLSGKSLIPQISDPASLWFGLALCFQHLMSFLDCRWADATFQEWWNHERFWFIMNSSSYLFGTVESLFKCIGLVETGFTVTPKSQTEEEDDNACSYAFTDSPLFIPLATLVMLFSVGILAATVHVIKGGTETFSSMFGEYLCGCWSLGIMYPILHQFLTWPKGIDTVPLSVMLPSCVVTTLFCVMVATFLY